jgi:hypothetical protein
VRSGEIAHQHQFHRQLVGGLCQAETDTRLDGNRIAGIVHYAPQLVGLLICWQETAQLGLIPLYSFTRSQFQIGVTSLF